MNCLLSKFTYNSERWNVREQIYLSKSTHSISGVVSHCLITLMHSAGLALAWYQQQL